MTLLNCLLVALGGAIGALLRFWVGILVVPAFYRFSGEVIIESEKFPLATFLVNAFGSFLFGVFYILIVEKGVLPNEFRQFVMIGALGAFTTFSTFSFETIELLKLGYYQWMIINILANVVTCLLAVLLGFKIANLFH